MINIVGGRSAYRRVTLASPEYTVSAKASKDGAVTCLVKKRNCLSRWALSVRWLPRFFRLMLVIIGDMSWPSRVLYCSSLAVVLAATALQLKSGTASPDPPLDAKLITLGLMATLLVMVLKRVGPWYGAERKAINAYEQNGSAVTAEQIAAASRVLDSCRDRLILPFLVAGAVTALVSQHFGWPTKLVSLAAVEIILWLDLVKGGFGEWSLTSAVNRALQRYVMTREPGDLEMSVAKVALDKLLTAHQDGLERQKA